MVRQESVATSQHPAHAGQDVQPPRPDAARVYPRAYNVLLSRSIFASNGVPSRRSTAAATPAPAPPPPTLSLKGISQEDARFTAFVEDAAANRIFQVRLGDAIGTGRVCDITLHDLTYETSGNRLRLEIDNVSGRSGPTLAEVAKSARKTDGASSQDNSAAKKKKKKTE